jgi:H+/gluconate symporter-like permease
MPEWFKQIPEFWQGWIGNLLATVTVAIVVLIYKTYSNKYKNKKKAKEKELEGLKAKLNSSDAATRTEGLIDFVFIVLKYYFIANILWIIPEAISPVLYYIVGGMPTDFGISLLKLIGLIYFCLGLNWIAKYYTLQNPINLEPENLEMENEQIGASSAQHLPPTQSTPVTNMSKPIVEHLDKVQRP